MLAPDYLARAPDALVKLWQQVEDDILIDVARRLGGMSELTETAEYQLWRLQQLRFVRSDVVSRLAKASSRTDAEIRRLFRDAGVKTLTDDDRIYRAAGLSPSDIYTSPALSNLLNAGYRQTTGLWTNLTATTANTVTKQFESALSHAWLQVSSGAFDYKTAISNAIKGLSASMAYITYPTGHVDTLEVAVRRAVLTGVNQTATKLQLARAEEMDCDLVETSAHQSARPSHAVWQGRVFSRSGKHPKYPDFVASTGYGTGAGLAGWNCRHSFYPFFEGLSETAYSRKELSDYEHATVTYRGKEMSVYDATQRQRALERQVRGQKREYSALKAAGQDASGAAVKLKQARDRLSDFCRQTGLREDGFRSAVGGFGRSAASSASWAARKSSTVYSGLHFDVQPVTLEAVQRIPVLACDTLDAAGCRALQNAHKRLLVTASKQPLGIEVSRAYGLDMKPLVDEIVGSSTGTVRVPDFKLSYILAHTHPDGNVFSPTDLQGFANRSNLQMLTAVGHDGHVYLLEKTASFDENRVVFFANKAKKQIASLAGSDIQILTEADKIIRETIKEMELHGIRFTEG